MTKGIILLEGPDCCGKTTLASGIQHICQRFEVPYTYIHADYSPDVDMFDYHTKLLLKAILASRQGVVVIDRLHWSEYVYANVYRGGSKWPVAWRFFERVLNRFAVTRIIANPRDIRTAKKWHKESKRDEMYDTDNDKVAQGYNTLPVNEQSHPLYYRYDRDQHPLSPRNNLPLDFAIRVLQNMEKGIAAQRAILPTALDHSRFNILGYGPTAKYLMLGEIQNPKPGLQDIWPFYGYAKSNLYLTQALDKICLKEKECLWTNFYSKSIDNHLHAIAEALPDIKVISFGAKQYEDVLKYRIFPEKNIIKVHHPAYASTYGTSNEEYSQTLFNAIYGE